MCFSIEVHFFRMHWEMKGQWSRVNLVLHATSVLLFPITREQKCTNYILIFMLNGHKTHKKLKKNQCNFFRHVTSVFHRKIFATIFLSFIAGE